MEGEVRKRATTDDQIFTIVVLLKDYILGKHASYQIRCQTKKTTRSNNLKVSSDGQEKRFWLFDFDGVAVNLQVSLVHTACNLQCNIARACAKGQPSLPPVTHSQC